MNASITALRSVTPAFNPDPDRCGEYDYQARHAEVLALIRQRAWDIVFLGDSHIHYWCGEPAARFVRGARSWARYYGARQVINLGGGWDRTDHVLWRLQHGELDGVTARAVVLLIGANNLGGGDTPAETAAGIEAVCRAIVGKLPQTHLLVLGVLPRGHKADDPLRAVIRETNRLTAGRVIGDGSQFLDVGPQLLEPDGHIAPDTMSDFLHLTEQGYERLARAIEPTLAEVLES